MFMSISILPDYAVASDGAQVDPGNTAFIMLCAALVMLMTPGLALFYGGMVRRKNVLSILMQCFAVIALAGLVAITPAAGFVSPLSSIIMGLMVGPICYLAVSKVKEKFGYDDSLDAFGIHGVGGTFGALVTGVFASTSINPGGADGLLFGNGDLFMAQLIAVIDTYLFAGFMTWLILKVISLFKELRVSQEKEEIGLDQALHGEEAYSYADLSRERPVIAGLEI